MLRSALIIVASFLTLVLISQTTIARQSPGAAQSSNDLLKEVLAEIRGLRSQIAALEERVAALEGGAVVGVTRPDTATAGPVAPQGMRLMRLVGVETVKADPKEFEDRLTELDQEAEILQRTVDQLKDSIAQMTGSSGAYGDGYHDTSTAQRRRALARIMAEHETRARAKRGEAARIRRQLNEPRQVIVGSHDGRTFTLKTENDQSCVLAKAKPGDFLTWGGWREQLMDSDETWVINRLEIVNEEGKAISTAPPAAAAPAAPTAPAQPAPRKP
jgi:hypothetical protein